ncbi:hypothetical protein NMY22_g3139 [Coprinellus aureogranulatus]|nr:hypothetical protein NMY22_g3139 [Coprinellus aureogranulatus]
MHGYLSHHSTHPGTVDRSPQSQPRTPTDPGRAPVRRQASSPHSASIVALSPSTTITVPAYAFEHELIIDFSLSPSPPLYSQDLEPNAMKASPSDSLQVLTSRTLPLLSSSSTTEGSRLQLQLPFSQSLSPLLRKVEGIRELEAVWMAGYAPIEPISATTHSPPPTSLQNRKPAHAWRSFTAGMGVGVEHSGGDCHFKRKKGKRVVDVLVLRSSAHWERAFAYPASKREGIFSVAVSRHSSPPTPTPIPSYVPSHFQTWIIAISNRILDIAGFGRSSKWSRPSNISDKPDSKRLRHPPEPLSSDPCISSPGLSGSVGSGMPRSQASSTLTLFFDLLPPHLAIRLRRFMKFEGRVERGVWLGGCRLWQTFSNGESDKLCYHSAYAEGAEPFLMDDRLSVSTARRYQNLACACSSRYFQLLDTRIIKPCSLDTMRMPHPSQLDNCRSVDIVTYLSSQFVVLSSHRSVDESSRIPLYSPRGMLIARSASPLPHARTLCPLILEPSGANVITSVETSKWIEVRYLPHTQDELRAVTVCNEACKVHPTSTSGGKITWLRCIVSWASELWLLRTPSTLRTDLTHLRSFLGISTSSGLDYPSLWVWRSSRRTLRWVTSPRMGTHSGTDGDNTSTMCTAIDSHAHVAGAVTSHNSTYNRLIYELIAWHKYNGTILHLNNEELRKDETRANKKALEQ